VQLAVGRDREPTPLGFGVRRAQLLSQPHDLRMLDRLAKAPWAINPFESKNANPPSWTVGAHRELVRRPPGDRTAHKSGPALKLTARFMSVATHTE
jgi:hypothetical protein